MDRASGTRAIGVGSACLIGRARLRRRGTFTFASVAGNPKTSEWYATPKRRRNRAPIELTLSMHARAKLERLQKKTGWSRSRVVEWLILDKGAEEVALKHAMQAASEE